MKPITTERLTIRPLVMSDLEAVHRAIWSDRAVAGSYSTGTKTVEETREWLIHHIWGIKLGDPGTYAVVRNEDEELIGLVSLPLFVASFIRFEDDPHPKHNTLEMELGYAFGSAYWGKGYATEACRAMVDYAFKELRVKRLFSGAGEEENPRSYRLAKRLGFRIVPNVHPDYPGGVGILDNDLL
jgi:ribosomal-protein-alanine N-acetyltransferase